MYHKVPPYLSSIIRAYLRYRELVYLDRDGEKRREMLRGTPEGSVLGPTLWNLGYDSVLRAALPHGTSVICYADDTLVLVQGEN